MKLTVKCNQCREAFRLKKSYLSRPELVADIDENFDLECSHCKTKSTYHANDVIAKKSKTGQLIGTGLGISIMAGTTLFFWNQGFITNIGFIIGGGIIGASNLASLNSNATAFNNYRI